MPLYNRMNRQTFASTVGRLIHRDNLTQAALVMFDDFPAQIADESLTLERFTRHASGGVTPSAYVAAYLGGCLSPRLGPLQLALQEGPLLLFRYVVGPLGLLALPWYARLDVALAVLRLVAHLEARHLFHCDFGAHQLGMDALLRVRMIDLGKIVPHRFGVDAPLGSQVACRHDGACQGRALHCTAPSFRLAEQRCNATTGRCIGFDALTASQDVCKNMLRGFLLPRRGTADDDAATTTRLYGVAALRRAIARLLAECATDDRARRLHHRDVVLRLRRIGDAFNASQLLAARRVPLRQFVANEIERRVASTTRKCLTARYC